MKRYFDILLNLIRTFVRQPWDTARVVRSLPYAMGGFDYARRWKASGGTATASRPVVSDNSFRSYFNANTTGPGIWKWDHYFDIYHRHFQKFREQPVNLMEIGIYSGGSLGMWRHYFGNGCHVHGVDIEEACRTYQQEGVSIHIGDQADRTFWREIKKTVPALDIVIDDGGHTPEQQRVTLEELLPHLNPGGIYLCEDVAGVHSEFAAFVSGLITQLNTAQRAPTEELAFTATPFQRDVYSIHCYPFVVVIERNVGAVERFISPRRGTEWQPFLG